MKRSIIVIAVLVTFAVPGICLATPPRPGPYVSGFAGVSIPRDSDVTTTDFSTPTPSNFNEKIEFDPGIYAGGTGGFDFGFLRVEGELSYRYSEMKTVTSNQGFQFSDVDGNLGALAMMVNAFFDLHNASPITPYFGGGVGFAVLYLSNTFGFNPSNGIDEHLYPEDNDTVFAYQAGAGVEIALNPMLSLDVGYRYFGTDTAHFESSDLKTNLKFQSHNAVVAIRVKF